MPRKCDICGRVTFCHYPTGRVEFCCGECWEMRLDMSFIKKANSVNPKRTLCEVLREIFDRVQPMGQIGNIQPIVDLLEEANTMAKKMDSKLHEYYYEKNENYEKSAKLRKDRDIHSK